MWDFHFDAKVLQSPIRVHKHNYYLARYAGSLEASLSLVPQENLRTRRGQKSRLN
jgi:hypothetical protein